MRTYAAWLLVVSLPLLGQVRAGQPTNPSLPKELTRHAACDSCHITHGDGGQQQTPGIGGGSEWLLKGKGVRNTCMVCHGEGAVIKPSMASRRPAPTVAGLQTAVSTHPGLKANDIRADRFQGLIVKRGGRIAILAANCSGCHDTHESPLGGVLGKTIAFNAQAEPLVDKPSGDFEVCFACHGQRIGFDPRGRATPVVFGNTAASAHPVGSYGKGTPSVSLIPGTSRTMTCGSCHGNSGGTGLTGPHYSQEPALLLRHYGTTDGTMETPDAYALCYGCHSRVSILSDASFPFHRLHITGVAGPAPNRGSRNPGATAPWPGGRKAAAPHGLRPPGLFGPAGQAQGTRGPTPCKTCHDPHGSQDYQHLVVFDRQAVSSASNGQLLYRSFGGFKGQCTLACHGVDHLAKEY